MRSAGTDDVLPSWYDDVASLDDALPEWHDDAALAAWTVAELNKIDDAFERQLRGEVPAVVAYARLKLGPRTEAEHRKRQLLFGRRAKAKRHARAIADADIAALCRLNPKFAQAITLLRKPGRPRIKVDHDPLSFEARLDEADFDRRRIRALWQKRFGRVNRPRGSVTAEGIAAKRWGLDADDGRRRRVSAATRARLARQR